MFQQIKTEGGTNRGDWNEFKKTMKTGIDNYDFNEKIYEEIKLVFEKVFE